MDWKEVREWIQLIFVIVGGTIALFAYFQNLRQRKLENSLKLVALFKDQLRPNDFVYWDGGYRPISDYFSEGSGDENAISRMAQNLEIICHELCIGTADVRFVYYELGQLLITMHGWLESIDMGSDGKSLLDQFYPSIKRICERHNKDFTKWPSRVYAYIE